MQIRKRRKRISAKLKNFKSKYEVKTAKDDPKLPGIFVFSGARGSGKTYAGVMLVKHFEKQGYITRSFMLCPTKGSNDIYDNIKTLSTYDVCSDEHLFKNALIEIENEIKKDWEEYEKMQEYKKAFKRYVRNQDDVSLEDEKLLEEFDYEKPKDIPKPGHMLIVDDAQGTNLFSNARKDSMNHLVIKHRHIPLSICFMAQSWTGLPRVIRLNATHFAIFATGDKNQLKQIYDAFANVVSFEQFENLYKTAIASDHNFLFIDTVPKKEYMRFRSGFNTYLQI